MKIVNLFYLSPNIYGGWATYTINLYWALRETGVWVKLFKLRDKTNHRQSHDFGSGVPYYNITLDDALKLPDPKVVVAGARKFRAETDRFIASGAFLVVHDPTELKNLPALPPERTIVIRRAGLVFAPHATFIRHPYRRACNAGQDRVPAKSVHATSTARVDFDKHTDILLSANRLLPEEKRIVIRGFENRRYTKFNLIDKHGFTWKQDISCFKRSASAAVDLLLPARFSVDMSAIVGDGGGTQYTFLEAWDAGAVLIINAAWNAAFPNDDMKPGDNCIAVHDAQELAGILSSLAEDNPAYISLRNGGWGALSQHDPKLIGEQYLRALGVTL